MNTVFKIGTEKANADTLLLEVGEDYCCYAFLHQASKTFSFISYISFDDLESEEKIGVVLEELTQKQFDRVVISSAYTQALLVPQQHFSAGASFDSLIFDTVSHKQLSDAVSEWQIVTSYSIPEGLYSAITAGFKTAQFFHVYTPTLKIYNGFVAANQVDLHFTTRHFRVLVKKAQQVQLAQTYSYKTPLDVVYYLLKICYEFNMQQSEVFLIISGLVEKDSAMYHELNNYFLNLHFAQAPSYALPETDHPHYYFTSLYNLAACVS